MGVIKSGSSTTLLDINNSNCAAKTIQVYDNGDIISYANTYSMVGSSVTHTNLCIWQLELLKDGYSIELKKIQVSGISLTAVAYHRITLQQGLTLIGSVYTEPIQILNTNMNVTTLVTSNRVFTGLTTIGTSPCYGAIRCLLQSDTAAAGALPPLVEWDFNNQIARSPIIDTVGQSFVVTNTSSATAITLSIYAEWIEREL